MSTHIAEHQTIMQDHSRTLIATLSLLVGSLSQACLGGLSLSRSGDFFSFVGHPWPGLPAMLTAALLLWLARGTAQTRTTQAMAGSLALSVLAIPAALYKLPWLALAYLVGGLLTWRGAAALHRTHKSLHHAQRIAPFQRYIRAKLAILFKAMGADDHIDQRERHLLRQVCVDAKLSGNAQKMTLHQARHESHKSIADLAEEYMNAASLAEIRMPREALLHHVRAMIESDGIVVPEEAAFLLELGRALHVPKEELHDYLDRVHRELASPSPTLARQLLRLPDGHSPHVVERAYQALALSIQGMSPQQGQHTERNAAPQNKYTNARLKALHRAYETLAQMKGS